MSGNTGTGVFKDDGPYTVYIDVNKIAALHEMTTGAGVILGANVKITDAIHFLEGSEEEVHQGVAHHLKKIASYGIRNQGSLGGNLMMKHDHPDFPSDVFLSLETAGAVVKVMDVSGMFVEVPIGEFLLLDMNRKILVSIRIPILAKVENKKSLNSLWLHPTSTASSANQQWKFKSYKIMPRSNNAHAYVNAGFLALVDFADSFKIIGKPRLVFGGINESFVHATSTEEFLMGRNMNDHEMFLEAMTILATELVPTDEPVLTSAIYRKQLALGLFYKVHIFNINNKLLFITL